MTSETQTTPANDAEEFVTKPEPAACCPPAEERSCCATEDKAECCGASGGGSCGCR